VASTDEGWTRFLLEQYGFPFRNLSNEEIRSGEFADKVDVLLFPAVESDILAGGKPKDETAARLASPLPPAYAGGLDKGAAPAAGDGGHKKAAGRAQEGGGARIKSWVEGGGTVVALDSSADYFIDLFGLPVTNVLAKGGKVEAPGSMLRILVDTSQPLAYGMQPEEAAYFADSPAFATSVPDGRFDRRVVARYPEDERDVLVSGYLAGGEALKRRAAVVDLRVGKGRVILIGFRPQYRAQTLRTFKLLFNALYLVGDAAGG
jgi:hypothetical protein